MGIYVQQQLEYVKLWKLVEFSQVPANPQSLILCPMTPVHTSQRVNLMLTWHVVSSSQISFGNIIFDLAGAILLQMTVTLQICSLKLW